MNNMAKNVKEIDCVNTIGILMCKKKNIFVIEYCFNERITVSEYKLV